MSNKEIASQFSLLSQLMDIHGENSFKSKTYSIAAYKISQLTVDLYTFSEKEIAQINGTGEAISKKIIEIISTGTMEILKNLILKTPKGIFEMLKIKGVGPKKLQLSGAKRVSKISVSFYMPVRKTGFYFIQVLEKKSSQM